ncbi:MAG: hypothetical protein ACLU0O_03200 [Collinsella sp.]
MLSFRATLDEREGSPARGRAGHWSLSARARRLLCRRRSLSATLSSLSRKTPRLRNWRRRLPRDAELAELRAKLEGQAAERRERKPASGGEARADAQKENAELQREIDSLRTAWPQDDEAKLAESAARNAAQNDLAARDAQIAELQARLAAADKAQERWRCRAESQRELDAARSEASLLTIARRQEKFSAKAQSEQEAEGLVRPAARAGTDGKNEPVRGRRGGNESAMRHVPS